MKSFSSPTILVTIAAILSVVAAVDTSSIKTTTEFGAEIIPSSSSSSVATTTTTATSTTTTSARRLDEDKEWDNGTKVYTEFPNDGWWAGTITSYNPTSEMYTVTWEDGSTDYYDDDDKIDQMVAYAQNDPLNNAKAAGSAARTAVAGQYSVGSKVSVFEEGEWCDGLIVQYGSDVDTYTIEWDDSEVEEIQAGVVMDTMIIDGQGDDDAAPAGYEGGPSSVTGSAPTVGATGFPIGTPVSYYDEDGEWQDGTITRYSDSTYSVMWQDGSTDDYDDSGDDLNELKEAVEDAYGDDDAPPMGNANAPESGPRFANGTPVSDFEDGDWIDGEVVAFQDGNYIVEWNDEDDVEYYASSNAEDMQQLTNMSQDALNDDDGAPSEDEAGQDLWKTGTRVAFLEDDVWYLGSITGFTNSNYRISWDDGETEMEDDFDFVNQMVADGATQSPLKTRGISAAGKAALSIFVIALCLVGSFFGYKLYERRQIQLAREERYDDDGTPTYRDEPSELPKII